MSDNSGVIAGSIHPKFLLNKLSDEDYEQWQKLIENRTGLQLADHLRSYLQTGLNRRMQKLNFDSYQKYLEFVTDDALGVKEWSKLVDSLTVQETQFFRHPASYHYLEQFLNHYIEDKPDRHSIEIWSVGCSSGEESYSLAMLTEWVIDHFNSKAESKAQRKPSYGVIGTDISLSALAKAKKATYGDRKLDLVPDSFHNNFEHKDKQIRVVKRISDRVCFARVNILDLDRVPIRDMDVIFCQNLLIYLRKWRRREVLNHLAERLKVGGVIVLGLGEVTDWTHPHLRQVNSREVLAFERYRA